MSNQKMVKKFLIPKFLALGILLHGRMCPTSKSGELEKGSRMMPYCLIALLLLGNYVGGQNDHDAA